MRGVFLLFLMCPYGGGGRGGRGGMSRDLLLRGVLVLLCAAAAEIHPANVIPVCYPVVGAQSATSAVRRGVSTHRTFPGGDESGEQLAEVGPGVCILLSQRKSFQLGGRAAVSEVGLPQGVGVSLKESFRNS